VEEPVLGNFLCDLSNVRELLGVRLESVDVVLHSFASRESIWDLLNNLSEVFDSMDEVSGLDVGKGSLGIGNNLVTSLVAGLNLFEVVVSGEFVEESSDEVWDSHNIELNILIRLVDWSDSCDDKICHGLSGGGVLSAGPVGLHG